MCYVRWRLTLQCTMVLGAATEIKCINYDQETDSQSSPKFGPILGVIFCDFTDKNQAFTTTHYDDVIMTMLASHITSLTVVYSIVYLGVDQRKHQSSASLAFVWGIHRGPVNSPHKWPVTRKMFPFDDVIMPATVDGCSWQLLQPYPSHNSFKGSLHDIFFLVLVWRPQTALDILIDSCLMTVSRYYRFTAF